MFLDVCFWIFNGFYCSAVVGSLSQQGAIRSEGGHLCAGPDLGTVKSLTLTLFTRFLPLPSCSASVCISVKEALFSDYFSSFDSAGISAHPGAEKGSFNVWHGCVFLWLIIIQHIFWSEDFTLPSLSTKIRTLSGLCTFWLSVLVLLVTFFAHSSVKTSKKNMCKYEFIYDGCSLFSFFNVQSFNLYTELKLVNVCASFTFISKHKNGEIHHARSRVTPWCVFRDVVVFVVVVVGGDAFLNSIWSPEESAAAIRTWTFL